jgi:hypothetical protein
VLLYDTFINLIPEIFGITFDSFKTKLNAYFMVDYCVVYEILCKYTKLMIILLCLIPLHTNLKLVDDYLLLFSKKINKKIVNKTKKETFNNLEKQEVNSNNIPNKPTSPNIKGEEVKKAIEDGDLSKQPSPKEINLLNNEYPHEPHFTSRATTAIHKLLSLVSQARQVISINMLRGIEVDYDQLLEKTEQLKSANDEVSNLIDNGNLFHKTKKSQQNKQLNKGYAIKDESDNS